MQERRHTPLDLVVHAIVDKKGFNTLVLDVRTISSLTEYFVIAEGRVERHTQAISREIAERLRSTGRSPLHVEGDTTGDWIVMDYGDIIVHLFRPGVRERYRLEQLWKDGKVVDYDIPEGDEEDSYKEG